MKAKKDYEDMWKILNLKLLDDSINCHTGESDRKTYEIKEILNMMELIEANN